MARRKNENLSLAERLARLKETGLPAMEKGEKQLEDDIPELSKRISLILKIIKQKPLKNLEMTYLVMYDISDDKVRVQIAKYLEKQGCERIQRSVFLARSDQARFEQIVEDLKEVNSYYQNEDSIIIVPVNASDVRSMKLIGKNVSIQAITDKPNTLFF